MNQGQLFWGSLLVVIGGLFLFREHLPLNFTWSLIGNLWPLALILAGVAVLLRRHRARAVVAVLSALLVGGLVFGMVSLFLSGVRDEDWSVGPGGGTDTIPLRPEVTRALLSCEAGASRFAVRQGGSDLVTAAAEKTDGTYLLESTPEGDTERVTYLLRPRDSGWGPWNRENRAELLLSAAPEWELDLECGASAVELDLGGLRVGHVEITAGAARIHVRLDALVPETRLEVESGVSSLTVEVPEGAGCEIRSETALARRRFEGFEKISSGLHRTENFETAENRIYIQLNMALSAVRVERY
jgi:hypothetical protein